MSKKKMQTQQQVIKAGKGAFPVFFDRTEERYRTQHMWAEVIRLVIMTGLRSALLGWLLSQAIKISLK